MEGRVEILNQTEHSKNTLYIMHRDQRVSENYSFNLAFELSAQKKSQFFVGCIPQKLKMNRLQEYFMLNGLPSLNDELKKHNVPFLMIRDILQTIQHLNIDTIVVEFCPLREYLDFHNELLEYCKKNKISLLRCDSHNIVPCRVLEKYVKTPQAVKMRLNKLWSKYIVPFPKNQKYPFNNELQTSSEAYCTLESYPRSRIYIPCKFESGCEFAKKTLENFFNTKLHSYKNRRNEADVDFLSNLSPYLHFGQISAQFVVLEAMKFRETDPDNVDCFISEVFHWREIAEHFCFHEKNYDNIKGALEWAQDTLKTHLIDPRQNIYSLEDLENAKTHDSEWNAAQNQLLTEGKIHGYARMYWAKSILKWTKNPETAIHHALYLNDTYSIDGNDPNGYLGVMWSICGVMDQGWAEKPIYGKIRTMKSIKAKNYVKRYTEQLNQ